MGSQSSKGSQTQQPGTLSPVTATILDLFGSSPRVWGGQFQPQGYDSNAGVFGAQSFAALPGLLQNQPLTGVESFLLGAQPSGAIQVPRFDQAGYEAAVRRAGVGTGGFGKSPSSAVGIVDPQDFFTYETVAQPESAFGGGIQGQALLDALQAHELIGQGAEAIPALLETDPTAAIAAARRGLTVRICSRWTRQRCAAFAGGASG